MHDRITPSSGEHFTEKSRIEIENGVAQGEFHLRKVWDRVGNVWKHFRDRIEPYHKDGELGFKVGSQWLRLIPVAVIGGIQRDVTPELWKRLRAKPTFELGRHSCKFGVEMVTLPMMSAFGWRMEGSVNVVAVRGPLPIMDPGYPGSELELPNQLLGFRFEDRVYFSVDDLYYSGLKYGIQDGAFLVEVKPRTKVKIDPTQSFYVSSAAQDGYIVETQAFPFPIYTAYNNRTWISLGYNYVGVGQNIRGYPGGFDTSAIGADATVTNATLNFYIKGKVGSGYTPIMWLGWGHDQVGAALDTGDWGLGPVFAAGTWDFPPARYIAIDVPFPDTKINKTGDTDFEARPNTDFWPPPFGGRQYITLDPAEGTNDPYLSVSWTTVEYDPLARHSGTRGVATAHQGARSVSGSHHASRGCVVTDDQSRGPRRMS
jgi:hypothetical protein